MNSTDTKLSKEAKAQQELFQSEFGTAYTDRNIGCNGAMADLLFDVCCTYDIDHTLEVGCNAGGNFKTVAHEGLHVVGVDVQNYALRVARDCYKEYGCAEFINANVLDFLPFDEGAFDLAFTSGVLIHIPPKDLHIALAELYRVSSKYILINEYFSLNLQPIEWRGKEDACWKQPFGNIFLNQFPDLKVLDAGIIGPRRKDDQTTWWLYEKGPHNK